MVWSIRQSGTPLWLLPVVCSTSLLMSCALRSPSYPSAEPPSTTHFLCWKMHVWYRNWTKNLECAPHSTNGWGIANHRCRLFVPNVAEWVPSRILLSAVCWRTNDGATLYHTTFRSMCSASAKCAGGRLGVEGSPLPTSPWKGRREEWRLKAKGERLEVKGTDMRLRRSAQPLHSTLYTLHKNKTLNTKQKNVLDFIH